MIDDSEGTADLACDGEFTTMLQRLPLLRRIQAVAADRILGGDVLMKHFVIFRVVAVQEERSACWICSRL